MYVCRFFVNIIQWLCDLGSFRRSLAMQLASTPRWWGLAGEVKHWVVGGETPFDDGKPPDLKGPVSFR